MAFVIILRRLSADYRKSRRVGLIKEQLKQKLVSAIANCGHLETAAIQKLIEKPKNQSFGEFAFPCFLLAKLWKKSPPECARKLAQEINLPDEFSRAEATGPFLNFRLNRNYVSKQILAHYLSELSLTQSQRVIMEYSSPNIAKPFHVGHLRATLIGNCLDRVYRFSGYDVVSINHLGDWGTQFGFVWAGCEIWGKPESPSVASLVDVYRRATSLKKNQENGHDLDQPDINEMARTYFLKLEAGEPEATSFWSWCRALSMQYLEQAYERLNVSFDHFTGESFYQSKLEGVRRSLEQNGILENSEGALGVDLGESLGFARIYTEDGRSLYLTRDLATAEYRAQEYGFDKAVYVVGVPQTLHFQQLVAILEKWGKEYADKIIHAPFGHVAGMSTRGGQFIELSSFLDEAEQKALTAYREQVSKRPPGLDEQEVAKAVALAAIIFETFSRTRIKDVEFSWKRALEFQGATGPYLLYAYARINGIREKVGNLQMEIDSTGEAYTEDTAFHLLMALCEFEPTLNKTLEENEPATLAFYTLELAKQFSKAYQELKIKGEEQKVASARLALFEATRKVLKACIEMLGMRLIERM